MNISIPMRPVEPEWKLVPNVDSVEQAIEIAEKVWGPTGLRVDREMIKKR